MRYVILLALIGILFTDMPAAAQGIDINVPGSRLKIDDDGGMLVEVPGSSLTIIPDAEPITDLQPTTPQYHDTRRRPQTRSGNYANADLSGMDFSGQDLTGADFGNATLRGAIFHGANLSQATMANADLSQADLSQANLTGADLGNATLRQANLTNANFTHAILANADLSYTLAAGTIFTGADMGNANTQGMVRRAAPPVMVQAPPVIVSTVIRDKLKVGVQSKIDLTVNFDFNSDHLTNDGARQVAEIAAALNDPALATTRVMIEGHTDSIGSYAYNLKLSERRAERVRQTLINQYSIPVSRLQAQGFGESRPVASNDNDLGRAKNRRVILVNIGS